MAASESSMIDLGGVIISEDAFDYLIDHIISGTSITASTNIFAAQQTFEQAQLDLIKAVREAYSIYLEFGEVVNPIEFTVEIKHLDSDKITEHAKDRLSESPIKIDYEDTDSLESTKVKLRELLQNYIDNAVMLIQPHKNSKGYKSTKRFNRVYIAPKGTLIIEVRNEGKSNENTLIINVVHSSKYEKEKITQVMEVVALCLKGKEVLLKKFPLS